ncbi:MAG: ABC transporter ATP-binding protein [Acidobacteria bacterium]|nr:ABC transporter ATP-binding protein [Acidobacteriota bacterium]
MAMTELFRRAGMEVSVRSLAKKYQVGDTTYPVLKGIHCEIRPSKVAILQGPSGCGKTTFLNMLGGIDQPDGGEILIGGVSLDRIESDLAHYRLLDVGFVFQAFNLIPGLSALDNLQLPMSVAGRRHSERVARAHALLELVGMHDKIAKRPDELSGGEQQRVAIAVALVNDPPLILADEPTGNLDSRNGGIVADLLCELARDYGKTVVICTHDQAVGERGDQIYHMRDGLITDNRHDEPHATS